jgi:hypothetical protein
MMNLFGRLEIPKFLRLLRSRTATFIDSKFREQTKKSYSKLFVNSWFTTIYIFPKRDKI